MIATHLTKDSSCRLSSWMASNSLASSIAMGENRVTSMLDNWRSSAALFSSIRLLSPSITYMPGVAMRVARLGTWCPLSSRVGLSPQCEGGTTSAKEATSLPRCRLWMQPRLRQSPTEEGVTLNWRASAEGPIPLISMARTSAAPKSRPASMSTYGPLPDINDRVNAKSTAAPVRPCRYHRHKCGTASRPNEGDSEGGIALLVGCALFRGLGGGDAHALDRCRRRLCGLGGLGCIFGLLQALDQRLVFRITRLVLLCGFGHFGDHARIRRQRLDQLAIDARRAGHQLALVEEVGLAREVADQAAGLGDDERARGHIPGAQARLEETIVVTSRHVAQVQGRGAGAAQAGALH